MPFYEVLHNAHTDKNGVRHEPGEILEMTETEATPFKFKLRQVASSAEFDEQEWPAEVAGIAKALDGYAAGRIVTVSITSAAQRLAEEEDIDWTDISGTGKDGRVTLSDVQTAVEEKLAQVVSIVEEFVEEQTDRALEVYGENLANGNA